MSTDLNVRFFGKVGPQARLADGAEVQQILSNDGSQIFTAGHGAYAEAVMQGRVMIASCAVTGVAMGEALSTTPPFALWNPIGSRVLINILLTSVSYLSGTLSYGVINYGTVIQATEPAGGTAITPKNARVALSYGQGRCYTGATQTAATVLITPYSFGPQAVATALGITASGVVDVKGLVGIDPGYVFVMESTSAGAGSTPLCIMGVAWEEIPI